ncbi:MAG: succinate dehydrogenase cytochrome b subunit [Deltaproteobacteria bacterium]|nr:succinate dehydrogenase cytochrome b subunit [Deltaproteobacteria bacterium]
MNGSSGLIRKSVAKKAIMALTGLTLCLFLSVHLLGNITLLLKDSGSLTLYPATQSTGEFFKWVAHHYEAVPLIFYTGEIFLLLLFGTHILLGITLWLQNRAARGPARYVLQKNEGGRTLGSGTMIYTGLFFIFAFLVIHLLNFRFTTHDGVQGLYDLVRSRFSQILWVAIYLTALLGLGVHLSHGFQSAFQSLGINHPRYTRYIKAFGLLFAVLIPLGFALVPVLILTSSGGAG